MQFFNYFQQIKKVWSILKRALEAIGSVVSVVFLVGFYYTIFLIIAVPMRLISRPFAPASNETNFRSPRRCYSLRADFTDEF